ncbi:MAG: hypothetical protein IJ693_01725 [Bacteroidaceae bacterium]|nr:hypothetical protein [Bacteroidaceae bacterium]
MKSEIEGKNALVHLLLSREYPRSSIRTETRIGGALLDIAIYSVSGDLLQVFEIKRDAGKHLSTLKQEIRRFYDEMHSQGLYPEVYVYDTQENAIWVIKEDDVIAYYEGSTDFSSCLDYQRLLGRTVKVLLSNTHKRIPDVLRWCSWLFAFILFVYVIASLFFCNRLNLTFELLVYMGVIYALIVLPILLPYIKRVKIGNVEAELLTDELKNLMSDDKKFSDVVNSR